jgi:stage III sporulation protein AD
MDSIKICALGLICALLITVVKQFRAEFSIPAKLAAFVILFGIGIGMLYPIFNWIESLMNVVGLSKYGTVLLKALGIALLSQICADICRDCGESSVASGVELAGKLEILILCLPLIVEIFEIAEVFLQ